MTRLEIPLRLPSLNEYIDVCRENKYAAAGFKKYIENDLAMFLMQLPIFSKPIKIHFVWCEPNRRRDCDNIAFAKKFILDAMVKCGKLKDDSRKYVVGFTDDFLDAETAKVIIFIDEMED